MITKIDIKKFGLYKDFEWKQKIGSDLSHVFKRVNIIYGRNYSGKTTLARIFKCIEDCELHPNCLDADFKITLDGTQIITPSTLSMSHNLKVRVYNSDFVKTNLSWLHNDDGSIKPFTILGSVNVELEKRINEIETLLGSEESKHGLLYELAEKTNKCNAKRSQRDSKKNDLDNKLRQKAQSIKNNATIYNAPTYQINSIKGDIASLTTTSILTEDKIEELRKLLKEESKPTVSRISEAKPNFSKFQLKTIELISKPIKPSNPLQELINNSLLQEWVRQGIEKHKGIRETCAFCGNTINPNLWVRLEEHFSKESEDLRNEIREELEQLNKAKVLLESFISLSRQQFYVNFQIKFDELNKKWESELIKYSSNLTTLETILKERENDIFNPKKLNSIEDNSENIIQLLKEYNQLIVENNAKTQTLSLDQQKARTDLRICEVAKYSRDIEYNKSINEILKYEEELIQSEIEKSSKETQVNTLLEEKRMLEAQAKDESKGAELVNQHLTNFFGHDELKLVAEGETPNIRFKITRESIHAKNLSEGECSLISFCYFIAKIEDELKEEINNSDLIIYIDDPISSLDANHIFFMFSLIESIIAKPKKYAQLFISTHNLDFLKYLKRLTIPDGKENAAFFLVERSQMKNDKKSTLLPMPDYIREYVTEFNYLFKEIYSVYKEVKGDRKKLLENTYNQFYNLPNNLRKFLECYLFYKYPNNNNPLDNLDKLFDGNIPSLINRVVNEYSHLTYIDRGWKPIDVDEAEDCAKIVIEKIKEKDEAQYQALCESIGVK